MDSADSPDLGSWRAMTGDDALSGYLTRLQDPSELDHYTREGTSKLPREVDHELQIWGCVACNLCVTVCPNDAFLRLPTPEELEVDGRQQYLCLAELCNECGNCTTFCPEHGAPWLVKPRLFLDGDRFANDPGDRPAFLIEAANGGFGITASTGHESNVDVLRTLLHAEEGLPLRPMDLAEG